MSGTIGPDVARAAVALHRSHPNVPAVDVLDVCLRQRTGRLADFGDELRPGSPFALIVAEAFDRGMAAQDWLLATNPNSDPALVAALVRIWETYVLPSFAAHYGLRA